MKYTTHYFAANYGEGTYGSDVYSSSTSTSTSTAGNQPGGALANTGFDLILAATIGSVIIFSALLIRFWRKPKKQNTEA